MHKSTHAMLPFLGQVQCCTETHQLPWIDLCIATALHTQAIPKLLAASGVIQDRTACKAACC